jgi:hypothetical protein
MNLIDLNNAYYSKLNEFKKIRLELNNKNLTTKQKNILLKKEDEILEECRKLEDMIDYYVDIDD